MKDNIFEKVLQRRFKRLNQQRNRLQSKTEKVSNENEAISMLKQIRSLDIERYQIFKRLHLIQVNKVRYDGEFIYTNSL